MTEQAEFRARTRSAQGPPQPVVAGTSREENRWPQSRTRPLGLTVISTRYQRTRVPGGRAGKPQPQVGQRPLLQAASPEQDLGGWGRGRIPKSLPVAQVRGERPGVELAGSTILSASKSVTSRQAFPSLHLHCNTGQCGLLQRVRLAPAHTSPQRDSIIFTTATLKPRPPNYLLPIVQ